MPSIGKYKKISEITEDNIDEWKDNLYTTIEESEVDMGPVYDIFDYIYDML